MCAFPNVESCKWSCFPGEAVFVLFVLFICFICFICFIIPSLSLWTGCSTAVSPYSQKYTGSTERQENCVIFLSGIDVPTLFTLSKSSFKLFELWVGNFPSAFELSGFPMEGQRWSCSSWVAQKRSQKTKAHPKLWAFPSLWPLQRVVLRWERTPGFFGCHFVTSWRWGRGFGHTSLLWQAFSTLRRE